MQLVFHVLLLGLAAAGVGALFRALPWSKSLLQRKPWVCPTCTGGHGAWMVLALDCWRHGVPALDSLVFFYFGATAIAALILTQLFPPPVDFGP